MRLMLPKNTLYETSNHSRKLSRRDVRAQRHSSCRNTCNIRIYHCTSLSIKNIAEWCRRTWTQKRRLNMHTSRTNEKSVCLRSPRWRILQNNKSCGLPALRWHESPSPTAARSRRRRRGGLPRILQNTPRECSCSTINTTTLTRVTHVRHVSVT